jgi:alkanesulfonate monooxygenase SsuD/methylene tetrahydromethanopterin reductase-like flavin-dependent oxidoreductase (luciferase family)
MRQPTGVVPIIGTQQPDRIRESACREPVDHHGEFYDLSLDAPRIAVDRAAARRSAGDPRTPPFYFGGLSEPARDVAVAAADVYLIWPGMMPEIAAISAGVSRQAELRDSSDDDGFIEDHLWTGIARARSGCGAAIVGDPDQVVAKLRAYMDLGIDAFILSGYPHLDECDLVARYVLPAL